MTMETMIGVDLAKSVFPVHGASMTGQLKFRKRPSRVQFRKFMAEHPVATVVMEACGSGHYWARGITKHGHEVKLIAPQYVRPFVKRQKNDAADAKRLLSPHNGRRCDSSFRRWKGQQAEISSIKSIM